MRHASSTWLAFVLARCSWVRKNEGAVVDGRGSILLPGQLWKVL